MFELIANPETGRVHRAVRDKEGNVTVQDRPAGKAYRTTDPLDLMEKLKTDFECSLTTRLMTRRTHQKSAFVTGLVCRERGVTGEYARQVSILCAHDGRHALRLRPGALRCACVNQFQTKHLGWRHNDPEIDAFIADPLPFVYAAMDRSLEAAQRVESLRELTVGSAHFLNAVCVARPRLGSDALDRLPEYHQEGELSLWSVLQAFTGTHNATLEGLTALALGPGFDELRRGQVPACVERALR